MTAQHEGRHVLDESRTLGEEPAEAGLSSTRPCDDPRGGLGGEKKTF
jgi:hypothetical protein